MKKFSSLKNLFIIFATSGLTIFGTFNRPLYSIPEPITVAVTKVLDRSNAPWFKNSFEDKFKTILSTELASAGHFIVVERDQEALKEALLNQEIAGAALDVYETEPPIDKEFLSLPQLITTPHIGGNSVEAQLNMGRSAIKHLIEHFKVS